MRLRDLLRKLQGERVAFDSSFFLHHLTGNSKLQQVTSPVLRLVEGGKSEGWVSVLILHDIFLGRMTGSLAGAAETCCTVLVNFPHLKFVPISGAIATAAAKLESEHGLSPWNALHVSCARSGAARFFLTSDRSVPIVDGMEPILLASIER